VDEPARGPKDHSARSPSRPASRAFLSSGILPGRKGSMEFGKPDSSPQSRPVRASLESPVSAFGEGIGFDEDDEPREGGEGLGEAESLPVVAHRSSGGLLCGFGACASTRCDKARMSSRRATPAAPSATLSRRPSPEASRKPCCSCDPSNALTDAWSGQRVQQVVALAVTGLLHAPGIGVDRIYWPPSCATMRAALCVRWWLGP
jgi:hypothetical protein